MDTKTAIFSVIALAAVGGLGFVIWQAMQSTTPTKQPCFVPGGNCSGEMPTPEPATDSENDDWGNIRKLGQPQPFGFN